MTPENLNFGDLIHQRKPFIIPPYQRAYEWKTEDIEKFINDIDTLASRRMEEDSYQHFFGGMVSVRDPIPGSYDGERYLVIDGQQRLATFSMVLALIVRELEKISRTREQLIKKPALAHATNIRARYLEDQFASIVSNEGEQLTQHRVVLSKVDRPFFESLLRNLRPSAPSRDSHKLLTKAWNKLHKGLIIPRSNTEMSRGDRIENLLNLQKVITDGCYIIHIISDNRSEAYRLFMTLNDRGKSLSDGDLLKSHTLELLEGCVMNQREVEENWNEILREDEKKVEDFLRAYLPSRTGRRAGRLTLYADFCDAFFKQEESQKTVDEVDKMKHESITFNKVDKGDWPYEDPTTSMWYKNRLNRLSNSKILKHTLCYPLLLGCKALLI